MLEKTMDKITFCIPSKNNLRYLKWCIPSIRKNASRDDHDIIIFVDKDTDGTVEWLEQNAEKYNLRYIVNPDINNSLYGIGRAYDVCVSEAKTDVCMIFHADMYLCKNTDLLMYNKLSKNSVVCATRIEPPLHPEGPEKIVKDFGMWPEEDVIEGFRESELHSFVDEITPKYNGETTNGCFAPWMIFRETMIEIGGHDPILRSAREDSDIFNRFVLNNMNLIQVRDGFVYHLTCRGGQFEHGVLTKEHSEKSEEWQKLMEESTMDYIRKWGRPVEHNGLLYPLVKYRFEIALYIDTTKPFPFLDNVALAVETWVSRLYISDETVVTDIINKIQPNSQHNIFDRVRYIEKDKFMDEDHDVQVFIKNNEFTQNDYNNLTMLSEILEQLMSPGWYELENLTIHINKFRDANLDLIKIDNEFFK